MAAEDAPVPVRTLEYTPTWALAVVCFFIVSVSLALEHSLHLLTNWLKRRKKNKLCDAVYRLKSELMLLGFLSLLLAITQEPISKICVSGKAANIMLPCAKKGKPEAVSLQVNEHLSFAIVADELKQTLYRRLAEEDDDDNSVNNTSTTDSCSAKGKVSFVTQNGIQQLHRFIFVLAIMQIVYSVLTMALGRAKMKSWNAWEKETQTTEYQVTNDPNRFRFTRQTTFGRRHMTDCAEILWIKCFFRQFFSSVAKIDYFTLRHGFITAHLSTGYSNFNFQKYIERTLEEDFKVVVSISPVMWFIVVIFMLLDVHGWHVYLWISFLPLLIMLVLGTKLQIIVARMALQIENQRNVIVGAPLVEPNDELFWFGRPKFVLALLHVTLFLNAFELAFFVWVTIEFGVDSCYHEHTVIIVIRSVLAVTVQVLCSYITLPLYALVTQMGSEFKSKVLEEQIAEILRKWHADVRNKRKKQKQISFESPPTSFSAECSSLRSGRGEFSSHSQPRNESADRGEIREAEEVKQKEQEIIEVADSNVVPSPPLQRYFQRYGSTS